MKRASRLLAVLIMILPGALLPADLTIKAGVNQSKLLSKVSGHWATGYLIGAAVSFRLSDRFELQPEVFFIRRGDGIGFPEIIPGMTSKITLDYLEMPVLLKWSFLRKPKFRMAVLGGGYAALNLRAASRTEYEGLVFTEDLKGDVNKTDFGLVAGVGLEMTLGKTRLSLDVRDSLGLAKINGFLSNDDWKNVCLSVILGLGF